MSDGGASGPIACTRVADGRVARITIDAGRGNILTRRVIEVLDATFTELRTDPHVCAVVLDAAGRDFSFGASVPEHTPDQVGRMLPAFVQLFRTIARTSLPLCAAVQGQCLGGAAELVLVAQHVIASGDAEIGLPEVRLGVFPPVASALLPLRVRQPVADRFVALGETLDARSALDVGIVDEVVQRTELASAAIAWAAPYAKLSAAAVRFATRAARAAWDEALGARLDRLERLYLDELMSTDDAREGIRAFLERRQPTWVDR
jgi:cyclohexa-1,5-dienecarbonyl-CoA hydratase